MRRYKVTFIDDQQQDYKVAHIGAETDAKALDKAMDLFDEELGARDFRLEVTSE
jgi:hypothetical protein